MSKTKHKQKMLKINSTNRGLRTNEIIEVDKGIYNLIKALNEVGLKTNYSCQGTKRGTAYITIDLTNVEEASIRDFGRTLSIWWKPPFESI